MGTHKRVLDFHVTGSAGSYDGSGGATVYPATTALGNGSVIITAVNWSGSPAGVNQTTGAIDCNPVGSLLGVEAIAFHTLWNTGFGLAWRKGQPIFGKWMTSITATADDAEVAQVEVLHLPTATTITEGQTYEIVLTEFSNPEVKSKIYRFPYVTLPGDTTATVAQGLVNMINAYNYPFTAAYTNVAPNEVITITGKTRTGGWPETVVFETSIGYDAYNVITVASSTAPVFGVANWFQVQDDLSIGQGYTGVLNNVMFAAQNQPALTTFVPVGQSYHSVINIEYLSPAETPMGNIDTFTGTTRIYCQKKADYDNIVLVLDKWITDNNLPFSAMPIIP